jgi:hypothetical protein
MSTAGDRGGAHHEQRRHEDARRRGRIRLAVEHLVPELGHEQGQRGEGGQPVVRELERREHDHGDESRRPQRQQEPDASFRGVPRPPRPAPERRRDRERPWQEPGGGDGEELERAEGHVVVGEHAMPGDVEDVVVHDRVPEEARIPQLDQQVPRSRDRDEEEHARPRHPAADDRALAGEREEGGQPDDGHDRAEQVLGEHRGREPRVEGEKPPPRPWSAAALQVGGDEAGEGERDAEHEEEVGLHEAREEVELEVGGDDEAGDQAHARAAQAIADPCGDHRDTDGGQRGAEAGRGLAVAEEAKSRGHQPVE